MDSTTWTEGPLFLPLIRLAPAADLLRKDPFGTYCMSSWRSVQVMAGSVSWPSGCLCPELTVPRPGATYLSPSRPDCGTAQQWRLGVDGFRVGAAWPLNCRGHRRPWRSTRNYRHVVTGHPGASQEQRAQPQGTPLLLQQRLMSGAALMEGSSRCSNLQQIQVQIFSFVWVHRWNLPGRSDTPRSSRFLIKPIHILRALLISEDLHPGQ